VCLETKWWMAQQQVGAFSTRLTRTARTAAWQSGTEAAAGWTQLKLLRDAVCVSRRCTHTCTSNTLLPLHLQSKHSSIHMRRTLLYALSLRGPLPVAAAVSVLQVMPSGLGLL
jgi:hypothetical protein